MLFLELEVLSNENELPFCDPKIEDMGKSIAYVNADSIVWFGKGEFNAEDGEIPCTLIRLSDGLLYATASCKEICKMISAGHQKGGIWCL